MSERRQFLTVPKPVCDICGERVQARLCGTRAMSREDVEAIQAILLAAHKMLAHRCDGVFPCPLGHEQHYYMRSSGRMECDVCPGEVRFDG